jgi:hypothetical protein
MTMPAAAVPVPLTQVAPPDLRSQAEFDRLVWEDPSRRQEHEAAGLGRVLLRRIGVGDPLVEKLLEDSRFKRAITLWAMEFPLNIQWYNQEIPKHQKAFTRSRYASMVFGIGMVGLLVALIFRNGAVGTAQFGVVVTAIFGVLQILAAGSDPKARLGAFRKARADLKEAMFTFQENWRDRSIVLEGSEADPKPSPDFMTAIYQDIRAGRKIARDERDAFFDTFKSANEILGAASTSLDAIRARRGDLVSARTEAGAADAAHATAVAARIQDLRNKLADATAQQDALADKKRRLLAAKADDKAIADVQAKIDDAETDRFKTQRLLDLTVKSDVAHSI